MHLATRSIQNRAASWIAEHLRRLPDVDVLATDVTRCGERRYRRAIEEGRDRYANAPPACERHRQRRKRKPRDVSIRNSIAVRQAPELRLILQEHARIARGSEGRRVQRRIRIELPEPTASRPHTGAHAARG